MRHPPQEADVVSGGFIARIALGVVVTMVCALVIAYLLGGSHRQGVTVVRPDINGIEMSPFATEAQGLAEHQHEEERAEGEQVAPAGAEISAAHLFEKAEQKTAHHRAADRGHAADDGGRNGMQADSGHRQIDRGTNQVGGAISIGARMGGGGGSTAPEITQIVASPWQCCA